MKKIVFLFALLFSKSVFANPACAVCTVAMGAFLGISRQLGVSDNATGVWVGALILMTYYFTIKFVEAKDNIPGPRPINDEMEKQESEKSVADSVCLERCIFLFSRLV